MAKKFLQYSMEESKCITEKTAKKKMATLETGDVFFAGVGCEHVAHPVGVARILVVEREGSV
jgi:hypothetical protein